MLNKLLIFLFMYKYYFKFLNKLKKYELVKAPSEGAVDFCERAILQQPEKECAIKLYHV